MLPYWSGVSVTKLCETVLSTIILPISYENSLFIRANWCKGRSSICTFYVAMNL